MDKNKNKTLGNLDTMWKLRYHPERIRHIINNDPLKIAPVTIHFAPTLECNHKCYFCTYGKAKQGRETLKMKLEDARDYIRKLHAVGVNGIIFTGGGDPCKHDDLIYMMEECSSLGVDFSLNTNGGLLTAELSKAVLKLNPAYVRVSINAGSPEIQKLMAGKDDFDEVLENLKALLINKIALKSDVNITVATVVGVINYIDLENLGENILKIENEVKNETKENPQIDIHIRPIYNHKTSKIYTDAFIEEVKFVLQKRSKEEAESFIRFIKENEQTPQVILREMINTIEKKILPNFKEKGSSINVYYPKDKIEALGEVKEKPYNCCRGLYFYGKVWSDGKLYPCVEYAGLEGFAIGDLNKNTAHEILYSPQSDRKETIDRINARLHDCPAVCAYNDINIYLDKLVKDEEKYTADKSISFI